MPKRYPFLLLVIITVLAAYLRLNQFLLSPPAFHIDESDIAYQAYSILKTGRDYHGNFLPIHPQSFTDRRPFLYMYTIIPFIAIFGLNEFAVRFPAAFFGILSIPAIFLLARKLFLFTNKRNKTTFGLMSAFILAILPWHVHYSRVGYELTYMLFTLIIGLYFFLEWLENKRFLNLVLSIIFLISTIYVYSTAKLFIPLLIFGLVVLFQNHLFKLEKVRLFTLAFITSLLFLPLLIDTSKGVGKERFAILSIFNDKNSMSNFLHYQWLSSYAAPYFPLEKYHPLGISKIVLSRPINLTHQILNAYLSPFSFQFLIFEGDPNLRHSLPSLGVAGVLITIFFIIGLVKLVYHKDKRVIFLILILLFISPIPSSITREGARHATRLFFFILPLTLISVYGLYNLILSVRQLKRLILIIFLIFLFSAEIIIYQHIRLSVYPSHAYNHYNWGWKQLVEKINKYSPRYNEVIIDNSEGAPIQTLYAFYQKINPRIFQTLAIKAIGKYSDDNTVFKSLSPDDIPNELDNNNLIIISNDFLMKHKFKVETIEELEIIDKVKTPTEEDHIYLISRKRKEPTQSK